MKLIPLGPKSAESSYFSTHEIYLLAIVNWTAGLEHVMIVTGLNMERRARNYRFQDKLTICLP